MDNIQLFNHIINKEYKNRKTFVTPIVVLLANALMLLSLICGWHWWQYFFNQTPMIFIFLIIICLIYGTVVLIGFKKELPNLFSDYGHRLKDWQNYYESKEFTYSETDNNYVPLTEGDIVSLSDNTFLRFSVENIETNKEILSDLFTSKILFSSYRKFKNDNLFLKIKNENKEVRSIYNRFGDCKWKKSQKNKPIKKYRKYVVLAIKYICAILFLLVASLPIIVLFT